MFWFKCSQGLKLAISVVCLLVIAVSGCDQKEKVIDVETPAGNIEVERSKNTGKVEVDINLDRKKQ